MCDEATSSQVSLNFMCRAGYVCDFGTSPDTSLEAPVGQFRTLCPAGYICVDGTALSNAYRTLCVAGYYCPTGTGSHLIGIRANDAVNRRLNISTANPHLNVQNVQYLSANDVRVTSDHSKLCMEGIDQDLLLRYEKQWLPEGGPLSKSYLQYLRKHNDHNRGVPYQNLSRLTGEFVMSCDMFILYVVLHYVLGDLDF